MTPPRRIRVSQAHPVQRPPEPPRDRTDHAHEADPTDWLVSSELAVLVVLAALVTLAAVAQLLGWPS